MEFGPETVLIIVGFGLSIFTILSAIIHSSWNPRRAATEPAHASPQATNEFPQQNTPQAEAMRDDTIRSFLAALEAERNTDGDRK